MADYLVPGLMVAIALAGLAKKQDISTLMTDGAAEGLKTLLRIVPCLVVRLSGIHMLRASGAMDMLTDFLAPVFGSLGIPKETVPLVLIRPFSGSAALAAGLDIMSTHGADSIVGRTAAIMLGSTETTFYTISVYFGAAGIRKTRYAVPAALVADMVGFCAASLTAKLFFA